MPAQPLPPALPLNRIIGRDDELAAVEILLRDARLVTIVGLGGLGKSRLAAEIAARASVDRPAYIVDLEGIGAASRVEGRIASVVGCPPPAESDPGQALIEHLAIVHAVLVLDGFEAVLEATPLVERILAETDASVLVTSRRPLHIRGEREFHLDPLPAADSGMDSPAAALFVREAERFGVTIGNDDADDVSAIVRYLDGWPLLIELAAARARLFPPRVMAARLARDLPTLPRAGADGDAIDAAIDWVLGSLDQDGRERAIELGVFPRRFGLDALAAIWEDDPIERLDALIGLGLVRRGSGAVNGIDFELPPPIRDGLRRRLDGRADRTAVWARLADYVRTLVTMTAPALAAGRMHALGRINAEIDSIQFVIEGLTEREPLMAAALVADLAPYWRFDLREGHGLALALLAVADLDDPTRARLLYIASLTGVFTGDLEVARQHVDAMLDVAARIDDHDLLASAHFQLGLVEGQSGQIDAAIEALRRAAGYADTLDDASLAMRIHGNLGVTLLDAGRVDEAAQALASAADAARSMSADYDLAMILFNLAEVELILGDLTSAHARAREASQLVGSHLGHAGDAFGAAVSAGIEAARGEHAQAAVSLAAAARQALVGHESDEIAIVCEYAAIVAHAGGRARDAARLLGAAVAVRARSGQSGDLDRHALRAWVAGSVRDALGRSSFDAAIAVGRAADAETILRALAERSALEMHEPIAGRYERLSAREMEVLALVGTGATDAQIGETLFISPKTASVHVSHIKGKLGLDTRIELALAGRGIGRDDAAPSATSRSSFLAAKSTGG